MSRQYWSPLVSRAVPYWFRGRGPVEMNDRATTLWHRPLLEEGRWILARCGYFSVFPTEVKRTKWQGWSPVPPRKLRCSDCDKLWLPASSVLAAPKVQEQVARIRLLMQEQA